MRRLGFALLLIGTALVAALFFSDFLTGREYSEYQDPYSRTLKVIDRRYGLRFERIERNPFSDYYYKTLKRPANSLWEEDGRSYQIPRFGWGREPKNVTVPPIMHLNVQTELAFLQAMPSDKVRIAVLQSLFQPRAKDGINAEKENERQAELEKRRIRSIYLWFERYRDDPSVSFAQWWRDNAKIFGLTPEGDPLPATPPVSPTTKTPNKTATPATPPVN